MNRASTQKQTQALKQLSEQFVKTGTLQRYQAQNLEKNMELLSGKKELHGAAKTRRKTVQVLLRSVYHDDNLGEEAFFMCAMAFSPTLLGTTKLDFVDGFRDWWCKTAVPAGFRTLTKKLKPQYASSLPQKDSEGLQQSGKRSHDDTSPLEIAQEDGQPQPIPMPSKRQRYGTSPSRAWRSSDVGAPHSDDDIHGDEGNENSDRNEGEKEHGNNVEREIAEPTTAAESSDVPLKGIVYKLTLKDVIKILGSEDPDIRLTMPDYPGVKPFVTFHCSEDLAKDFVVNRPKEFA